MTRTQLTSIRPDEPLFPDLWDVPEEHVHRWHRLLEERDFRLEQIAELDRDLVEDPRHDSVRRALRIAAQGVLSEIEAALDRLERGVYGDCLWCSAAIPADRLDVRPMTALCMRCHYNQQNCLHPRARALSPEP